MCKRHLGKTQLQYMQSARQSRSVTYWSTISLSDNEIVDQYVTDLKKKAQTCKFQDLKDDIIWDRMVCRIQYDKVCSRLISKRTRLDPPEGY